MDKHGAGPQTSECTLLNGTVECDIESLNGSLCILPSRQKLQTDLGTLPEAFI